MENTTSAELSAQLDGFFALNLDLLSITDKEHRFVRVNQAWADFLGIPVEHLVGRSFLDFIHPQDKAATHQGIEQILREGELVRFVNRYRYRTGEYRSIEWNARQVGDLFHSAARDITSHLEHEADLIRRAEFESMLFSLSSLLVNADADSVDSVLNTILKEIGTHTRCERVMISRYAEDPSKTRWMYTWSRHDQVVQPIQQVEFPLAQTPEFMDRLQKGEEVYLERIEDLPSSWCVQKEYLLNQDIHALSIIPISGSGGYFGFLAFQMDGKSQEWMREERGLLRYFARDLGQMLRRMEQEQALHTALAVQKAMYEETVRLNREIEYFMAKLSHDVRTAVHSIIGFNRMLLDSNLQEHQLRYAKLIKNSGEFLYGLVRNVLDFSTIQAGKVDVRQMGFSLRVLIDSCIATFSLQAEEKKLQVYAKVDVYIPPKVKGDPDLLARVLTNILSNAINNTSHGSVSVVCQMTQLHEAGLRISIKVSDTGRGIPPEELETIFEPYRQVKPLGMAPFHGSGLGLPICRCLIEAMRGTITVSSEVGSGSQFTIEVPLEFESSEAIPSVEEACTLPPVVLYETDPISYQRMEELLSALRVSVLFADTPHAVARLSQAPLVQAQNAVQIFFSLDCEDGDIYEEIINLRAGGGAHKWIYLMATEFSSAKLQCYEPLVDGFLLKPIQTSRLSEILAAASGCMLSTSQLRVPEVLVRTDARRVLIVDDSRINQEIVVYLLERMGIVADSVDDGEQALEMLAAQDYDLLLLDLHLPGLGGADVARTVRELEVSQGKKHLIIAMTASLLQGEREHCLSIGFDDFLEKPVSFEVLFEVVSKWMPSTV